MAGTVTFIELVSGAYTAQANKVLDGSSVTTTNGGSPAVNTDIFLTGTSSVSEKVSGATVSTYFTGTAPVGEPWNFNTSQSDDGNHIFMIAQISGTADTQANGGFGIVVADDLVTDSVGIWYVGPQAGSLGGWEYFVINPSAAFNSVTAGSGSWTTGGNPGQLTGVDGMGVQWKVTNTIMGASDNAFMQTISVGVGYRVTGTGCTFADFSSYETTNRFGALQTKSGTLFPLSRLRIGIESGAGNTDFTDSGFTVIWQGQVLTSGAKATADGFYSLSLVKGSGTTTLDLSNGTLAAASPETFDLLLTGGTTVTINNISVDRARLVNLDDAVTWNNGQVKNSGAISCGSGSTGPIFKTVSVLTSTVAADTSALVWNINADPDGNLDNCTFSKGTNAHHAIEFGTSSPLTMTLRGIAFTGFSALQDNNASIFHIKRTTGTVTINLIGCSSDVSFATSYRTDGASVSIVQNPVTFSVTAKNLDTGAVIENARVMVPVTSNANFPYQASVTITGSGTTATVTHTSHGRATNDNILIAGANQDEYNGAYTITVTGTNTYTYTTPATVSASPATGTITATMVLLNGLTNASGVITDSRTYSAAQPVSGWVRKATGSPLYRQAPVADTVSNTNGLSVTVFLQPDE